MLLDPYVVADFEGLSGRENPQDHVCPSSTTGFVVTFANFPLLFVSKIYAKIYLFIINSEYMSLHHSVRDLLRLNILIKEVIDKLEIDSENLKFVSISIVYEYNNLSLCVATISKTNPK